MTTTDNPLQEAETDSTESVESDFESNPQIDLIGDDDDGISIDITRRSVLMTAFAGTLGWLGAVEQAEAQASATDYQVNNIAALVPKGEPSQFTLGNRATITIGWEGLRKDQQINIRGSIAPEGGEYETLSVRTARVQSSSGSIDLTPSEVFCNSGDTQITKHSEISLSDLTVDDPRVQDIIQKTYSARIEVETLDGQIDKTVEDTFTVSVGVQYGFGLEFGLNFGVPEPEGWSDVPK